MKRTFRKTIRLRESELMHMISESVKRVLRETELGYDIDNFSGRYYKNPQEDEVPDSEHYFDNPYNKPNSWDDEDWVDNDKDLESEYSWELFDRQPISHNVDGFGCISKGGVSRDIDRAIDKRNREKYFTDRDNAKGRRQMRGFVRGRDPEDF